MRRISPPQGYITAIEVKARLNISDAMIRYYVQQEKIGRLVPPGRKQGFYLEADVDRLAKELEAFASAEALNTKLTCWVQPHVMERLQKFLAENKDERQDALVNDALDEYLHGIGY